MFIEISFFWLLNNLYLLYTLLYAKARKEKNYQNQA